MLWDQSCVMLDIPIGLLKKVTVYKGITVDSGTFGFTVQSVDYLVWLGHGLGLVLVRFG